MHCIHGSQCHKGPRRIYWGHWFPPEEPHFWTFFFSYKRFHQQYFCNGVLHQDCNTLLHMFCLQSVANNRLPDLPGALGFHFLLYIWSAVNQDVQKSLQSHAEWPDSALVEVWWLTMNNNILLARSFRTLYPFPCILKVTNEKNTAHRQFNLALDIICQIVKRLLDLSTQSLQVYPKLSYVLFHRRKTKER